MDQERKCLKCGKHIPYATKINGKTKRLKNRKYCLECSPFGGHNTKRIHSINIIKGRSEKHKIICKECGKECLVKAGFYCYTCSNKKQTEKINKRKFQILGYTCWHCGYGGEEKHTGILDMHHIDQSTKRFDLNKRSIRGKKWIDVIQEMKKCTLLCCRCHREVHSGLISIDEIKKEYENRWLEIGEINEIHFDSIVSAKGTIKNISKPICFCKKCNTQLSSPYSIKTHLCRKCLNIQNRKVERPSKEILEQDMSEMSMVAVGKKYGVSDNAIRKWIKYYKIVKN